MACNYEVIEMNKLRQVIPAANAKCPYDFTPLKPKVKGGYMAKCKECKREFILSGLEVK